MEGTQPSAAATRKRRSSILKSQRPPRTPFSELEFNVATPTDPGKSRRVSFSRRTGVAEFVTNEATTTWRNVYEEQNRSLESSGQEARRAPAPAGCMFDRQFQEVEAEIDFAGDMRDVLTNNLGVSVTDQFAMLENTGDAASLAAPHCAHEHTELTDHQSKIFRDDLTSAFNDLTDRVDVNFSAVKDLARDDDLDDIVNDLRGSQPDAQCAGLFSGRNASQYIEIDFNVTQGLVQLDGDNESDMSITATIQSPKKELSMPSNVDLKMGKDMSTRVADDKENIVVNPYVPLDIDCSIKEESQKVLVFDGKKLKYADINDDLDDILEPNARKCANPQKMPNATQFKRNTILFDNNTEEADVSVTHCVPNAVTQSANLTRNFTDEIFADVSTARGESGRKIGHETFEDKENKHDAMEVMKACDKTKIFDDNNVDVSMTEMVISNVPKPDCKRCTIVFDSNDIDADISVTKCIPNLVLSRTGETLINKNDDEISFTRTIPEGIQFKQATDEIGNKRKTIVFNADDIEADVSMTKCIPNLVFNTKAINQEDKSKRKTIVFQSDDIEADVSMTKAIPNLVLHQSEGIPSDKVVSKRQTILFDADMDADISMTKAIPNLVLDNAEEIASVKAIPKRQTILFQSDDIEADISMTKAIPNLVLSNTLPPMIVEKDMKRQTIVYESNDINADISVTKPIPNLVLEETEEVGSSKASLKRHTIIFQSDDVEGDISMTKAIPNLLMEKSIDGISVPKRQTIVFEANDIEADLSVTKAIPNLLIDRSQAVGSSPKSAPKTQTFVYDLDSDVSMTRCIPNVLYDETNAVMEKEQSYTNTNSNSMHLQADKSVTKVIPNVMNMSTRDVEVYNVAVSKDVATKYEQKTSEETIDKSSTPDNVDKPVFATSDKRTDRLHLEVFDVIDVAQTRLDETTDQDHDDSAIIDVDNMRDEECMSYVASSKKSAKSDTTDVSMDCSQKHADDTKYILEMISDLTDKSTTAVADATQTIVTEQTMHIAKSRNANTSSKEIQAYFDSNEVKNVTFNDTIDKSTSFAKKHEPAKSVFDFDPTDKSPLRKRAKSDVIPNYTMSDEVKELMEDLVKPMADIPFTMPATPTRNSEIQANVSRVSSPVDVVAESYEAKKLASEASITDELEHGLAPPALSSDITPVDSIKSLNSSNALDTEGNYVVWDNRNPLNNVLIKSPNERLKVHKYNPMQREHRAKSRPVLTAVSDDSTRSDAVTSVVTINAETRVISTPSMTLLHRDVNKESGGDRQRRLYSDATVATETPTHESPNTKEDVEDQGSGRNSVETSMSDDKTPSKIGTKSKSNDNSLEHSPKEKSSIFKRLSNIVSKTSIVDKRKRRLSDTKSPKDETKPVEVESKSSKEVNPTKRTVSYVDLMNATEDTPSPVRKEDKQKRSVSYLDIKQAEESRVDTSGSPFKDKVDVLRLELEPLQGVRQTDTNETELIFRGNLTGSEISVFNGPLEDKFEYGDEVKTSENCPEASDVREVVRIPSEMEIRVEDARAESVVQSVAPSVGACESLIGKIDLLPFMGTDECRWLSRRPPRLSFLLLHGRVELRLRVAGSSCSSSSSDGDGNSVQLVATAKQNAVTALATRHALASMRDTLTTLCTLDPDTPACSVPVLGVLRGCAAAARVAARWALALNDARERLAMTVGDDCIVMKVANVPLRSVWEVRLSLARARAAGACHPRVSHARAQAVVGAAVADEELAAVVEGVPDEWGHVPRTVWKVFRHLKNKRREDD